MPEHLFIETLGEDPLFFFSVVFTVIFSVCLHELAHGWAAIRLGDRTPIESGHMTLDPWVHMGWMSIVALLVMGLAWGAMPVDRSRLRHPYGHAIVALAGPATNLALSLLAMTGLGVWLALTHEVELDEAYRNVQRFLGVFGSINAALFVFNLLPVPPLDGSSIVANVVPRYQRVIESAREGGVGALLFIVVFVFGFVVTLPAMNLAYDYMLWVARTLA